MDQDMIELTDFSYNDIGYRDLARRLEAFADLRLSPSTNAATRMRTSVMNAAHRRAALMAADAALAVATEPTGAKGLLGIAHRAESARTVWRRAAGAAFAGCLTLGLLAGTAYASRAGGPLYDARLWTETVNLPSALAARAEAEVNRLDERLDEAQEASAAGDARATAAALSAYSTIVVEAVDGSDGDPTATATIEASMAHHVAVLTSMVQSVPVQARGAAESALSSSATTLDDLDGPRPGSPGGNGAAGSGGSNAAGGAPNGSGTPRGYGAGGVGGDPAATTGPAQGPDDRKSNPTSKPDRTPSPVKTHEPTKTHVPASTHVPNGSGGVGPSDGTRR